MGARMLRAWLARPLTDLTELNNRQDAVERFVGDPIARAELRDALRQVPDLERLTNRVRAGRATPRDLAAIGRGLAQVPVLIGALGGRSNGQASIPAGLKSCDEAAAIIEAAIAPDPPVALGDGKSIRPGFDDELDETRSLAGEARSHIVNIEAEARQSTGIKSLKVGYNKVFGYYIEVSRPNLGPRPAGVRAPADARQWGAFHHSGPKRT